MGGVITTAFAYIGKSTHGHGHVTQTGGNFIVQRNLVMDELKPADSSPTGGAGEGLKPCPARSEGSEAYRARAASS